MKYQATFQAKTQDEILLLNSPFQHMELWEREQESREDNFKCQECGKLFYSQRALSNHVGQYHRKHRSVALPTEVQK